MLRSLVTAGALVALAASAAYGGDVLGVRRHFDSAAVVAPVVRDTAVSIDEPPTSAMLASDTVLLALGSFYGIDQQASGGITLFRLASGASELRLDSFAVSPYIDLEIRLSPVPQPRRTSELVAAPSVFVAGLDVSAGSMNFAVPPEVDPQQFRSAFIWSPKTGSVYAAASLELMP